MLIKIDTREHELFKRCTSTIAAVLKFKDIQLVSETLPLGDIIINDGVKDCIIIERKTIRDLEASIRDGRYEEQSYRLNGLQHSNHNIMYLIEGDISRFKNNQPIYSALFSINYFKGFSVMRSANVDETAMIVCNMVCKLVGGLKAGKTPHYGNEKDALGGERTEKDYCSVVKRVKKDNVTPDNIGEIMLCQIPGVSSTSALAILAHFKTLPNLIQALKEDPACLNNISTVDSKGKSRKINKTAIATILAYLHI